MNLPTQKSLKEPCPALVIGQGVTLLGVLRGLAAASIPAYVINEPQDMSCWSRWYRRAPWPPVHFDSPAALADDVGHWPLKEAVLIPCSDSAAVAAAGLPAELAPRFRTSCCAAAVQALFADKWLFAQLLQELGVPHPETIEITSPDVIAAIPDDDLARFFLKPLNSERFSQRYGVKACLLRDKTHALKEYARLVDDSHAMVLQEYIPGPATCHFFIDGFVDRHGRVRARFARRRIRMYPTAIGNSTCMISVPLAEVSAAARELERLLAEVDYRGVFSAEFKRDPRDGVDKLLEINARPWWYIGFAQTCGLNVAAMAYRDACGFDVDAVTDYAAGRWCVYPMYDVRAAFRDLRAGCLNGLQWAESWLRGDQPVFAWSDLGPSTNGVFRIVSNAIKKLVPGNQR